MNQSLERISAIILRHWYTLSSSWPRLLEMIYWPILSVVTWGFITQFFSQHSSLLAQAGGLLLGAVLLWDVLFRSQLGVSLSYLEEVWSRNLVNLFVSALRPWEYVVAILIMSVIRTLICIIPAMILAYAFYHYNILTLGWPLLIFFAQLLVMGWWLGLIICALLLRVGMGAESMAWAVIFMLSPISGIYYPISTLPEFLQYIAWMTPAAYVFEGMRSIMLEQITPWGLLFKAAILNGAYMILGVAVFIHALNHARRHGRLLAMGE
jgi:ABC-2 type transport system permease protein